jgi:hypothetical protein
LSQSRTVNDINDRLVLPSWIIMVEVITIWSWVHVMMSSVKFWTGFIFLVQLWSYSELITSDFFFIIKVVTIWVWIHIMVGNVVFWSLGLSKSWSIDDINDWLVLSSWIVMVKVISVWAWIHVMMSGVKFWACFIFLSQLWSDS